MLSYRFAFDIDAYAREFRTIAAELRRSFPGCGEKNRLALRLENYALAMLSPDRIRSVEGLPRAG